MKRRLLFSTVLFFIAPLLITACSAEKKEAANSESVEPELPSLQAKLDERAAGFEKRASDEIKKIFSEGVQAVAESEAMSTALKVGDTAPDFILPNARGQSVQLATVLQNGPVILTWYRGGW